MQKIKELYLKYKEIINYLIVGVATTIVSLAIYYGLTLTVLDANNPIQLQVANVISWIGAVTFAYFTNKIFVFESKAKGKEELKEASQFVLARLLVLFLDMFFMFLMVTVFHMNDKIAKLIDQVLITVSNYVLSKLWVFNSKDKKENKSVESADKTQIEEEK